MAFQEWPAYGEALGSWSATEHIRIRTKTLQFKAIWGVPSQRGNVPAVYRLDELAKRPGEWVLREIRAMGDKVRCVFIDASPYGSWWVHAFPKKRAREGREVERAIREAEKLWLTLRGKTAGE